MNFTSESSHPPAFGSRRLVLSVSHSPFGRSRHTVTNCASAHFSPVVIERAGAAAGLAPAQLEFDLRGSGGRVKAAGVMCVQCRGEAAIIFKPVQEGKTLIRKAIRFSSRNVKTINPVESGALFLFSGYTTFSLSCSTQGRMKKYKS